MMIIDNTTTLEDFKNLRTYDLVEEDGRRGKVISVYIEHFLPTNSDDVVVTLQDSSKIVRSFPRDNEAE